MGRPLCGYTQGSARERHAEARATRRLSEKRGTRESGCAKVNPRVKGIDGVGDAAAKQDPRRISRMDGGLLGARTGRETKAATKAGRGDRYGSESGR